MKTSRLLSTFALALALALPIGAWAGSKEVAHSGDAAGISVMPPTRILPGVATPTPTPSQSISTVPSPELKHPSEFILNGVSNSAHLQKISFTPPKEDGVDFGPHGQHFTVIKDNTGHIIAAIPWNQLVTTAGKNYLLTTGLDSGSATTSWFVGMLAEASDTTGSCTSSSSTLTLGVSKTTTTGQPITVFGAGTSGANLVTTISSGATSTTQTLSSNCLTTVTSQVVSLGPTLAAADTMASHAGWSAIAGALITNGTWPAWTANGVASAGSISNSSSPAVFTMGGSISTTYLWGLYLTSNSALTGSTGTLYSEGTFTVGAVAVGASYSVSDTYTLSLTWLEDMWRDLGFSLDRAA